jgi:ATP-dependent DNA helicase RecQ
MLRRDAPVPRQARPARAPGGGPARLESSDLSAEALSPEDMALFERLKAWRKAIATEQNVPAYTVFHNATLKAIAATRPASLRELSGISGVGEAKLAKYGQQILDLLSAPN